MNTIDDTLWSLVANVWTCQVELRNVKILHWFKETMSQHNNIYEPLQKWGLKNGLKWRECYWMQRREGKMPQSLTKKNWGLSLGCHLQGN